MGERHNTTTSNTRWSLPVTAAALVCLAGTSGALAQAGNASTQSRPMQQAGSQAPKDDGGDQKVKVDDNLVVDLHVNDESLAAVLQMLSMQSQKNIIASRNVAATITANLYGVSFYEALDAILHVNGYGYIERNNFIYVYTLEELEAIAAQQRQMVWKVMKLNYLNSTDAAEFVKPLLSEKGQIKTNGKTGTFTMGDGPVGGEDFAHESTLLVFDFTENIAEIENVLLQMDTRPAQVLVEATILQTALNEANAFGVDFSILGDLSFGDFVNVGGPLKAVDALIGGGGGGGDSGGGTGGGGTGGGSGTAIPNDGTGRAVVSTAGNTSGPATFKAGIVQNDVAAFLRLLDEVSDTQIISRPNLLALNRVPARVLVGRKVGYLNTTSTDTATTQTVEFLETGTQLFFRPFVSADGMIRMELKPKVSEAVIRNVTNTGGAAITIPDEISNELTTNVMVRDGQTIVLGGLFKESTQATRRQVPIAGDIPIIGAAFRGHDDATNRQEIIFLITPTIMADSVLLEQGQRGLATVERVRAGSREGLLPWSRERRTQQLIVQATELAQEGRREEALYKVQRALRLNKNQPDAIALREELTGERNIWPSRYLQDEIIRNEVERSIELREPGAAKPTESPARALAAAQARALNESGGHVTPTSATPESTTPATTPATEPAATPATEPVRQADAEPKTISAAGSASETTSSTTEHIASAATTEAASTTQTASAPSATVTGGQSNTGSTSTQTFTQTPSSTTATTTPSASFESTTQDTTAASATTASETTASSATTGAASETSLTPFSTGLNAPETPATTTEGSASASSGGEEIQSKSIAFQFRSVWELLRAYANHSANPDDTRSVTSVPTETTTTDGK